MNSNDERNKLVVISIFGGILLTILLTMIASIGNSRAWGCIFAWQACLVQALIHTPDNPIHEASPIDLFAFVFGILLGIPIYSGLAYMALSHWNKTGEAKRE